MTPDEARKRCEDTLRAYRQTRSYYDVAWTLNILYSAGKQWGYVAEKSGNLAVKNLPTRMEPYSSRRIRVTLDETSHLLEKLYSQTNPQRISASPIGHHDMTGVYVRAAGRVLDEMLHRMEAREVYSDMNFARTTLGTAGIRLSLKQVGPARTVRKAQGRRPPLTLRKWGVDWSMVYPWQCIRDPAANTLRPDKHEDVFGYEQPMTLDKMAETYGWTPNPDAVTSTKADLLNYHDELMSARGYGSPAGRLIQDSKAKAVLVYEFYLVDPKASQSSAAQGLYNRWPRCFIGYCDPRRARGALQPVPTVGDKGLWDNPFCTLPFFFFHYRLALDAMWAVGMPWTVMQGQDIHNAAMSWLVEAMNAGLPKWVVESGTIPASQLRSTLNNNPRTPIVWRRTGNVGNAPQREAGMQIPSMAHDFIDLMPSWMQRSQNIAGVQMGQGYKRDGSGKAYETLIREAETVPENRVRADELTLGRLLRATTIDTIRLSTLKQLRDLVGPNVPDDQVRQLKRNDPRKHVARVKVHPTSLRPKTRDQTEEHFLNLVDRQMLMPSEAVLEILLQTGTALNSAMRGALENQADEINRMIRGEDVEPMVTDHHEYHAPACKRFLDHPRAQDLPEEVIQRILTHWSLHMKAISEMGAMALGQSPEQEQPQRPSAPANAIPGEQGIPSAGAPAAAAAAGAM